MPRLTKAIVTFDHESERVNYFLPEWDGYPIEVVLYYGWITPNHNPSLPWETKAYAIPPENFTIIMEMPHEDTTT